MRLVIEATANALAIARIIEPHVHRVVLADPQAVREVSRRAKTDRIDAQGPGATAGRRLLG